MKDKTQLEQLKEILTFVWEKGVVMDITDNEEIAQQILDLCQPQWIDVNERLPDEMESGGHVYYENDIANAVTHFDVYLKHLGFCVYHKGNLKAIVGVISWRPRPEPPGESE